MLGGAALFDNSAPADFYTPLALNCLEGPQLPALEVYENQPPTKVRIVLQTLKFLSGLFLVGAVNRVRKRKGTNRENPRTIPGQIGKIPEKLRKVTKKVPKRTKKEGQVQIAKPPRLKPPPRLAALDFLHCHLRFLVSCASPFSFCSQCHSFLSPRWFPVQNNKNLEAQIAQSQLRRFQIALKSCDLKSQSALQDRSRVGSKSVEK